MLIYDEYRKAVDKLQDEVLDLDERINYRKLELRKLYNLPKTETCVAPTVSSVKGAYSNCTATISGTVNLASTPLTPTGLERLENIYENDEELAKLKYKKAAVKLKLDYLRANGDLP